MVTCFNCMKPLPDLCSCAESDKEKLQRYKNLASRELDLILAIFDGFKPKILTPQGSIFKCDHIRRKGWMFHIVFPSMNLNEGEQVFTLLDKEDKSLYRRQLEIFASERSSVEIYFDIGISV